MCAFKLDRNVYGMEERTLRCSRSRDSVLFREKSWKRINLSNRLKPEKALPTQCRVYSSGSAYSEGLSSWCVRVNMSTRPSVSPVENAIHLIPIQLIKRGLNAVVSISNLLMFEITVLPISEFSAFFGQQTVL